MATWVVLKCMHMDTLAPISSTTLIVAATARVLVDQVYGLVVLP